MSEIIIVDPRQSGISGDMLISAFTDFFKCYEFTNNLLEQISKVSSDLFSTTCNYKVEKSTKNHIFGSTLVFEIKNDFKNFNVQDFKLNWKKILEKLNTSRKTKELIFKILDLIISTEKFVHGKLNASLDEIHFHELNSIDTIIDITVLAYILEYHKFPTIFALPTAIGDSPITFSHGQFQQPAPAVSKLLEESKFPFVSINSRFELTTPTGLSILLGITPDENYLDKLPSGRVVNSGFGLGQKQIKGFPNFLKIWKIILNQEMSHDNESLLVLETNVDDVSGEILGNVIDNYSSIHGIKDVSIYPLLMKKSRPGHCIRILFDPSIIGSEIVSNKLMEDTGTLGIRVYPVSRHKTIREVVQYDLSYQNDELAINERVKIKISKAESGKLINIKPEYDDLNRISKITGISVRELSQIVTESYKNSLN